MDKKRAMEAIDRGIADAIEKLNELQAAKRRLESGDDSLRWIGAYPTSKEESKIPIIVQAMMVFREAHGKWPTRKEIFHELREGGAYLTDGRSLRALESNLGKTIVPTLFDGWFTLEGVQMTRENMVSEDIPIVPAQWLEEKIRSGEEFDERREKRRRKKSA